MQKKIVGYGSLLKPFCNPVREARSPKPLLFEKFALNQPYITPSAFQGKANASQTARAIRR